jgi:predicted DNA-binding transcriptional regulator YafY
VNWEGRHDRIKGGRFPPYIAPVIRMLRPATRVLTVLELLQTHGQLSGAELARRLEVDPRTLRRYIAMLEEIGIPITAEQGRHGGYRLVPGFKLPPMMFTEDEVLAVSLGLVAARGLGLADAAPAVASAQAKLERVMPAKLKRRVRDVDETVSLEPTRSVAIGENTVFSTLSNAAQSQRRVHMSYQGRNADETERELEPYGLVHRAGSWYVVGHCCLREAVRSFRLDRIRSVRLLEQSFVRPAGFDARAYLVRSVATLPRAFSVEVWLKTDLESARRHVFQSTGVLEEGDGGVLLRAQADDLDWMARELMRLPFEFAIRAPPELLAVLRARAQSLLTSAALS